MAQELQVALVSTEKSLQSMNNLEIHPRSSQSLLLNCRKAPFTLEINFEINFEIYVNLFHSKEKFLV